MTMPSVNHDRLRQRRERRTGSGWKPKEGPNKVRILPPRSMYLDAWEKMEDLAVAAKVHFFRIEGKPATVSRCLEQLKSKCPACDAWRAHRKSADPGFVEKAKQIAPADQYFFNILDINDLKSGVQAWAANYTCWDKILEVAANPAWGNVVNPADGVNFDVSMTPGKSSRTGFNQYSVMPEPQRTTVMAVLQAIPEWQKSLDNLDAQIPDPKTPEEIITLLEEMGFPTPRGKVAGVAAPQPQAPSMPLAASAAPAPVVAVPQAVPIAVAPVAPPLVAPAAVPVAPAAVQPVAPAPVQAIGFATPGVVAAQPVAAVSGGVHYDPGPSYTPVLPEDQRIGLPRCYGDYDPKVHGCRGCPAIVDCQMAVLNSKP